MKNHIIATGTGTDTSPSCCPVCGEWLRGEFTSCDDCLAAHHNDCWEYNQGCGVHDCRAGLPKPVAVGANGSLSWLYAATAVCVVGTLSASLALLAPLRTPQAEVKPAAAQATIVVKRSDRDRRVVYYGGTPSLVTYGNLGNMYARSGEYGLAIACYEKVTSLDPNFSFGFFNLGNLYHKNGQNEAAARSYLKALELDPSLTEAYCNLGIVCQRQGHYDRAVAYFKKALDIDPKYAGTYYSHLGEIAYEQGDGESAIDAFARAIREDSSLAVPKNNLAYLYAERGTDLMEAMLLVDEALMAESENPFFLDTKGWIYYKQGDYTRAEEYLERAHNRAPEDMEIRGHLVEVWAKLLS